MLITAICSGKPYKDIIEGGVGEGKEEEIIRRYI